MHKIRYLALFIGAIWWSLLLLPWVSVEGSEIAGVDLSQTLTLLPAIYLLAVAISLYGKGRAALAFTATGSALAASWLAAFSDWRSAAAVESVSQDLTGIVGAEIVLVTSVSAYVFSVLGIVLAVLGALGAVSKAKSRSKETNLDNDGDSRSMWDEQGR